MDLSQDRKRLIATAAVGALVLAGGGVMLGRTVFAPAVEAPASADHAEEENHGPEGFVAIDATRAEAAGIVTEAVQAGGLASEILAQGVVAATPDGEAILTARADGAVTSIRRRLGDNVRAGEAVATIDSREAATMSAERSSAAAKLALARSTYVREKRLFDAGVTARQDLEGARAALSEAEAEANRSQSAAAAAHVSGNGRSIAVISLISGTITKADATLGSFVAAGAELFRVTDPRRIQINAAVLPADARRVGRGDPAVMELIGGETGSAVVRSIAPSLDPESKTATVVLQPRGFGGLTPGQVMRVRIIPRRAADSAIIALPEEAVQTVEGREVVFVRTAKGFQAVNVVTGKRGAGRIEIIDGVAPGTVIATTGAFLLKAELGKGEAEH